MTNSATSTTPIPTYAELLAVIAMHEITLAEQKAQIAQQALQFQEQKAEIKEQQATIERFNNRIVELEAKVTELQSEVAKKDLRIKELIKQLYGKKSEKNKGNASSSKGTSNRISRDGFNDDGKKSEQNYPAHLPRIEEIIDNLPEGANPDEYELIGESRVSRLATLPVLHYVLVTVYRTFKKKSNSVIPSRKSEHVHPLGKCSADISFIVFAIIQKILFHVPFYRLEKLLALQQIVCHRSNLIRWSERLASLMEPIAAAIQKDIKSAAVVYGDESPAIVKTGEGDESNKFRKTYFWNLVAPERGIYFHWTSKRNRNEAQKLLNGIQGTFVSDALDIYQYATNKLSLMWAICWIHIRRNFVKAISNKELSEEALYRINMILRIDKAIRARTKTEDKMELRFRYRQKFLLPLVDRMRQWISEHISSPAVQTDELMLTAFNYIDRRWEEATCFIRDPRVLPHNNIPEQYFRFLKLGTKNWLFCASEWGAETLCTLYTLVYSAKMLNINPSVYLTDVIQQIDVPGVTADQLVPRVWKETREKIATERYFSKYSSSSSSEK